MPITDELRSRILATAEQLQVEKRSSGTRSIINYLRAERPVGLTPQDEDALWDAGWRAVVGQVVRGIVSEGGRRTVLSTTGEGERSYKQLRFIVLPDALGILQMYESSEHAYRIQARGWWEIVARLRVMPAGTTVADLFPNEERWDLFWTALRASDLWADAA